MLLGRPVGDLSYKQSDKGQHAVHAGVSRGHGLLPLLLLLVVAVQHPPSAPPHAAIVTRHAVGLGCRARSTQPHTPHLHCR